MNRGVHRGVHRKFLTMVQLLQGMSGKIGRGANPSYLSPRRRCSSDAGEVLRTQRWAEAQRARRWALVTAILRGIGQAVHINSLSYTRGSGAVIAAHKTMLLTGAWDARFHIGGAGRGAKVKDFSYVEASDQDGGFTEGFQCGHTWISLC